MRATAFAPWSRAGAPTPPATAAKGHQHYRNLLNATEQAAYDLLRGSLARFDAAVALPQRLDARSLQLVFQGLKLDEPELFYVSELTLVESMPGPRRTLAVPTYVMSRAEAEAELERLRAAAEPIARAAAGLDDFGKLAALHDGLAARFTYDDADALCAHEATGALVYGRGVCDSAAKALKYLCDRCGIPAVVAIGQANSAACFPGAAGSPAATTSHAWNLVRVRDGAADCWYHLDVTHDALMGTDCPRYDYFCLSDADISSDHSLSADAYYPRCPRSFGYYPRAGRFAASRSELERILRQARATGESPLVFQLPRMQGADARFTQQILQMASDVLAPSSPAPTTVHLKSNPSQMVFQVTVEPA